MRHLLAGCLVALVSAAAAVGAAAQPAVFVVRHAERADAGGAAAGMMDADPDLSAVGRARAESLAAMLRDAKITAIFATEYRRTQATAAPLARALGIPITRVPSKDAAALAANVKAAAGNVLVVGHSNTVPEVIKALGATETVAVGEQDFDNLFIVVRGDPPALVRLHYR